MCDPNAETQYPSDVEHTWILAPATPTLPLGPKSLKDKSPPNEEEKRPSSPRLPIESDDEMLGCAKCSQVYEGSLSTARFDQDWFRCKGCSDPFCSLCRGRTCWKCAAQFCETCTKKHGAVETLGDTWMCFDCMKNHEFTAKTEPDVTHKQTPKQQQPVPPKIAPGAPQRTKEEQFKKRAREDQPPSRAQRRLDYKEKLDQESVGDDEIEEAEARVAKPRKKTKQTTAEVSVKKTTTVTSSSSTVIKNRKVNFPRRKRVTLEEKMFPSACLQQLVPPSWAKECDSKVPWKIPTCERCQINAARTVIVDCGHMAWCIGCSRKGWEFCPVCEQSVSRIVPILQDR